MRWGAALRAAVLAFALVVGALLAGRALTAPKAPESDARGLHPIESERMDTTVSWTELSVVYFSDVDCAVCTDPEFLGRLTEVIRLFRLETFGRGVVVRTVGVSIGNDHSRGLELVRQSGIWDEISLGGRWSNGNARALVWSRRSVPMTPQVVVFATRVSRAPSGEMLFEPVGRLQSFLGRLAVANVADGVDWSVLLSDAGVDG